MTRAEIDEQAHNLWWIVYRDDEHYSCSVDVLSFLRGEKEVSFAAVFEAMRRLHRDDISCSLLAGFAEYLNESPGWYRQLGYEVIQRYLDDGDGDYQQAAFCAIDRMDRGFWYPRLLTAIPRIEDGPVKDALVRLAGHWRPYMHVVETDGATEVWEGFGKRFVTGDVA